MGVSRLDSFPLLKNQTVNTTGAASATETPLVNYPVNALISVHAFGVFGAGTLVIEVTPDGTNWVAPVTSPASLTAAGVLTWQGVALGVRAKLTGATAATLTAIAVFQDQN